MSSKRPIDVSSPIVSLLYAYVLTISENSGRNL
jgi:hypothetical protein